MTEGLTGKQKKVLDIVGGYIEEIGYPPTLREVSRELRSSVRTVRFHLRALARKGYLRLIPGISRGIEMLGQVTGIPILGRVSAGKPLEAMENIESYFDFKQHFPYRKYTFMLRVRGDSMIEEGIHDGDLLVVQKQQTARNRDVVVAMVDGEALVKKFFREKDHIKLQAANPEYPPLRTRDADILGKVTGVIRKL